jgi:ELWxxDGT repeat protein
MTDAAVSMRFARPTAFFRFWIDHGRTTPLSMNTSSNPRPSCYRGTPWRLACAVATLMLLQTSAPAAVRLVKDINTLPPDFDVVPFAANPIGSEPNRDGPAPAGQSLVQFLEINGVAYFKTSLGAELGAELYRTDGTAAGTYMVRDINIGSGSSNPGNFVRVGDTLYFTADDGCSSYELWKSDGTEAGTVLVQDVRPGERSSQLSSLTGAGGLLFFTSFAPGVNQIFLHRSDGTAEGTFSIKGFPATFPSSPRYLTESGGLLFFAASDGSKGVELWKSDGTADGTSLVRDVVAGFNGSNPFGLTSFKGKVYYFCDDGVNGVALWQSDGSEGGTVMVKDPNPGLGNGFSLSESSYRMAAAADFFCFETNDGVHGSEVWRSDGTTAGTGLLKDIRPGAAGFGTSNFTPAGTSLYFVVLGAGGREIWKTNGTEAGTVVVSAVKPTFPASLYSVGSRVFYTDTVDGAGREMWTTDGTDAGTLPIADFFPGVNDGLASAEGQFGSLHGQAIFFAQVSPIYRNFFLSDGTLAGTREPGFRDSAPKGPDSSPSGLVLAGSTLFFSAATKERGYELWKSDGQTSGTAELKEIRPGSEGAMPSKLTRSGSSLYFWANAGTGYDLWKSDGSGTGTMRVKSSSIVTPPVHAVSVGNNVIFNQGGENWWSDGTAAGTFALNVQSSGGLATVPYYAILGPEVFFTGRRGNGFNGLWKTNGTPGGTVEVAAGITPENLITVGNGIVFWFRGDLWRTDGTLAGTQRITTIPAPAPARSRAGTNTHPSWVVTGNKLYFGNDELYVTDGTLAGTRLVKDIFPGEDASQNANDSKPYDLVVLNDTIYFAAASKDIGRELWKSNGTAAGTVLVNDIRPGACGSGVSELAVMDGKLYFNANDGQHGAELWQSDGTAEGTSQITDLFTGSASSYPVDITPLNGKLYFIASSYTAGRELWSFDPAAQEEGVPALSIDRLGPGVRVSWPVSFNTWNLEFSNSLNSGAWIPVVTPVVATATEHTVTLPHDIPSRFFRLRRN